MKPKSAKYLARAQAFCEAVDLAVAIRSAPPYEDKRDVEHWCKERAAPPCKNPVIANLGPAELETFFFTSRALYASRKSRCREGISSGRLWLTRNMTFSALA